MTEPPFFQNVTLIGIGLMGGSLGLALRQRGLAGRVVGVARREETRAAALDRGIVDAATGSVEEGVRDADLVVLATPLGSYGETLQAALPSLRPGCFVTDLGSAKAQAIRVCEAALRSTGAAFVGGHPMVGSEETGPDAARADLYEGAVWCLTPTDRTDPFAQGKVHRLAEAVGARVLLLSPEAHDLAVAASSHVPHLAAVSLVNALDRLTWDVPDAAELTAGGFRDTTRVASGSPEMWRDICLSNQEGILRALRDYRAALGALEEAVKRGDGQELEALFTQAQAVREKIVKKRQGTDKRG